MKLLSVVGALALVFGITSCSQEMMEKTYTPDNYNVTFEGASATYSLEGQDLVVKVNRGVAEEAISVPVTLTDPNGVYSLSKNTADFAEGEYTTELKLSYNPEALKPAVNYTFTLAFDAAYVAASGSNKITATCMMPLEYEEKGSVLVVGNYLGVGFQYKLHIAKYTNNYYMIENLMDSGVNLEFNIVNGVLNITSPSMVGVSGISSTLLRFPSKTIDVGVGLVTFMLDGDPQYVLYQLDQNGLFSKGSIIQFDAVYNMNSSYYGWYKVQIHGL